MKFTIVKSMTCPSCFIVLDIIEKIKQERTIEIDILDYDFDGIIAKSFNPGSILPVIFALNDDGEEIDRLVGEHNEKEINEFFDKYNQK